MAILIAVLLLPNLQIHGEPGGMDSKTLDWACGAEAAWGHIQACKAGLWQCGARFVCAGPDQGGTEHDQGYIRSS